MPTRNTNRDDNTNPFTEEDLNKVLEAEKQALRDGSRKYLGTNASIEYSLAIGFIEDCNLNGLKQLAKKYPNFGIHSIYQCLYQAVRNDNMKVVLFILHDMQPIKEFKIDLDLDRLQSLLQQARITNHSLNIITELKYHIKLKHPKTSNQSGFWQVMSSLKRGEIINYSPAFNFIVTFLAIGILITILAPPVAIVAAGVAFAIAGLMIATQLLYFVKDILHANKLSIRESEHGLKEYGDTALIRAAMNGTELELRTLLKGHTYAKEHLDTALYATKYSSNPVLMQTILNQYMAQGKNDSAPPLQSENIPLAVVVDGIPPPAYKDNRPVPDAIASTNETDYANLINSFEDRFATLGIPVNSWNTAEVQETIQKIESISPGFMKELMSHFWHHFNILSEEEKQMQSMLKEEPIASPKTVAYLRYEYNQVMQAAADGPSEFINAVTKYTQTKLSVDGDRVAQTKSSDIKSLLTHYNKITAKINEDVAIIQDRLSVKPS